MSRSHLGRRGLRPGMARDRLHQIMFIGVTGGRFVPSTTAVFEVTL